MLDTLTQLYPLSTVTVVVIWGGKIVITSVKSSIANNPDELVKLPIKYCEN